MRTAKQRGFTLLELMVTLTVAGILFGIGVPSLKHFMRNSAMSAAVNNWVTNALLARAEAIKRHAPVTLCSSTDPTAAAPTCSANGAAGGFIVFVDDNTNGATDSTDGNAAVDNGETILRRQQPPGGSIKIWPSTAYYVTYAANGFKTQAKGQASGSVSEVLFCDDRGNKDQAGTSTARLVKLDWIGRTQVYTATSEVSSAATALSATCS